MARKKELRLNKAQKKILNDFFESFKRVPDEYKMPVALLIVKECVKGLVGVKFGEKEKRN